MLKKSCNSIVEGVYVEKKKHAVLLAQTFSDDQQHRRNAQEKTDKKKVGLLS